MRRRPRTPSEDRRPPGPVRVMFVVPNLRFGGAERHVITLIPRLDPDRFSPSLVCLHEAGEMFGELAATGLPAVDFGRPSRQAPQLLWRLVRTMRAQRPDIVIARGHSAEVLARIAGALAGVPRRAVWIHNCEELVGDGTRNPLHRLLDRLLEPLTSDVFGVAEAQRPYLTGVRGHDADKIRIVHNGVDVARRDAPSTSDPALTAGLGIEPGEPTVAVIATLRAVKDHATAIDAFAQVLPRVPRARLVIVGDGPLRDDLEGRVRALGITDRVTFTGFRDDVADLLPLVDVVALPSRSECFPMAVLEAMAARRPIVCTRVGGVPEMVDAGVTAHVVEPGDVAGFADALVDLLSDLGRARSMGEAGRRRVEEHFTLAGSVTAAEDAIEDAVRGRRPRGRRAGPPERPARLRLMMSTATVGGAEIVLFDMFRHLDPARVRPEVMCLQEAGHLAEELAAEGYGVTTIGRRSWRDVPGTWRAFRHLRRDRPDVLLVCHFQRGPLTLGPWLGRLAGVPAIVIAVHGMGLRRVGGRALPRHVVETLGLVDALALLVPSQSRYLHEEEGVGRFPWRRVREYYVPNGIRIPELPTRAVRDEVRRELGLRDDDVVVMVVARLVPLKGHDLLLDAVARVVPDRPRVRVVLVGEGPLAGEITDRARELGLLDQVLLTGLRRDVPRLLAAADIGALPSAHEAVPLSVIEEMAAGLPVVVTAVGGLPDTVDDGQEGFVVPYDDPEALAERLALLCDDEGLRQKLGAAARHRAETNYSIEETARAYEHLVDDLLGARSVDQA